MALQPLGDVTQQPDTGDAEASRQPSFREQKLAELQAEPQPVPGRREHPAESEDPETGYPEDYPEDDGGHHSDGESEELGALEQLSPESEDEPTADETELSYDDLRDKYRSLEQEFSRVTANRKKIEQDFSDGITENIGFRHQLEDLTSQAKQRAEFFLGMANQAVQKWEKIDWQNVPPEKMANYKQRYQKAVSDRNQLLQVMQATQKQNEGARELVRRREAEIARNQLQRRIPEWSDEHYGTLREHAKGLGYSVGEYNDLTDWRVIDLIHRDWQSKQAVDKVQNVKRKNKARPPRNRNSRPQPRNADGRYQKARDEAFDRPGDKSSFREMKMREMERERRQGR